MEYLLHYFFASNAPPSQVDIPVEVVESTCIEVRNVKVRARQTERVTVLTRNAQSRTSIIRLSMHRFGNSGELRTQVGMVA